MDLPGLCLEYVTGQSTIEPPKCIAKAVNNGEVDLVKLVEALGIYLTSTNVDNRSSGTRLLSEVLTQLRPGCLNPDEVHYMIEFYCDRLKDKVLVIPHVLTGIHALATQYTLADTDVVALCRTIFKEVYNQSQQYPDRRLVYAIVHHFLTQQLQAVQIMSSEFVLGYIQAVDGERDPRNLLTAFHSVYLIIVHLDFASLAEDLFEVISCYFPIDFSPPANDPLAVTKESLVLALRKCLTATEKFAEFCLPLLLEKLTSDLLTAKLDSLATLAAGASVYGTSKLHPFLQPFWTTIKREMYQTPDHQLQPARIQVACTEALTALAKALSQPLQVGSENMLESFIATVLKDCRRHLAEPELRLITPTVHLLNGIAMASDAACTCVASSVLPSLVQQASVESQASKQRVVLEALLIFISTVKQTSDGEASTPLITNKDALLKLLTSATTHTECSLRVVAIRIFGVLFQIRGAMERSETLRFMEHLKQIALTDQESSVREAGCSSLALLASIDDSIVKEHLIPSVLALRTDDKDSTLLERTVDLLSALSVVHPSLLQKALPRLVEWFDQLQRCPVPSTQLASCVCLALVDITRRCICWGECQKLLAEGLLQELVAISVMSRDTIDPVLENVATILSLYTQTASDSSSEALLSWLVRVLVTGEVSASEATSPLAPLCPSAPSSQSQLISLLTAVLGASSKPIVEQFSESLLPVLRELSLHCEHRPTYNNAAMCYASVANKMPQDGALSHFERQVDELWSELSGTESSVAKQERVLNLWVWMSKALLMSGHPLGMDMALKLMTVCSHTSETGALAADGFGVLMCDSQYVLNLKCHANVRLFYKQQLFMQIVPKLVELFKSTKSAEGGHAHLLKCLSHLMQGVPKQVLLSELPTLFPLLLESMGSEDAELKLSTVEAVRSLITDAPQSVEEHVPALVPRLLKLACDRSSMKVRMVSLSSIGKLTSLPTHSVYPYQATIIKQLAPCLDDHKRLVRKEAVDARSKWYLLGTVQ